MWPVFAAVAFGFVKGFSSGGREAFNLETDLWGPAREEAVYRGPLWLFPKLPYGSTAVVFAADHVVSDMKHDGLTDAGQIAARFGDVLLGGLAYESAMRRHGILAAIASHMAHNLAVAVGSRARNNTQRSGT